MSPIEGRIMVDATEVYFLGLRWTHFLAGITWIGLLYYFNFVQVPTFKELDGATKNVLIPKLVKRALRWFRWSAVVTVLVGWLFFFSRLALDSAGGSVDLARTWWYVSILTGGLIGTFMLMNVWGVIWRNQKRVIQATEELAKGTPAPPDMGRWGKQALIASRMNLALSLPLLFFMGAASHLTLALGG
jgi:uncharacterized membrane protein